MIVLCHYKKHKTFPMAKMLITTMLLLIAVCSSYGQEHNMDSMDMSHMQHMNDTMPKHDSMMNMGNMDMNGEMRMPAMTHSFSLSLPMNRNGSGTSWSPDNNPMYMLMAHTKKGMWMFHGSVFIRYNTQQLTDKTSRSDAQFDAPN